VIDPVLRDAMAAAEAAAPGIRVAPERFAAHVARHAGPDRALAALRLDHLWLACAASDGDAAAIARIVAHCFERAAGAVRALGGPAGLADEALQRVRTLLFVGTAGKPPKIAEYAGRGDLPGWIRTIALREAYALLAPPREVPTPDQRLGGYALPAADPGVALMKDQYGDRFKQALADALAALPDTTRTELRRYYLEGLGLEQIAALEGVAASTISRRLDKARRTLHETTRRLLAERLRVDDAELDSILRLLDSRLDLSRSAV
jgi:RNA polymerase sigma-70 factor, ECF subfamily